MNYQQAKRDFGSFNNSNVNELVEMDDSIYETPDLDVKFDVEHFKEMHLETKFGSDKLRRELFFLTNEFCFLNHGAFGMTFKPVLEYVGKWKEYAESQPLRFHDRLIIPLLADLTRLYAKKVLDCHPTQLALVESCTFAFNSLINSIVLKPGEKVLIYNTTYGVYKKIFRKKCMESNAELVELTIEFPILDESDMNKKILNSLETTLDQDNEKLIKFIMIDFIPSTHPFILPVVKLSEMCKKIKSRNDIVFIVDAAHSLGSIKYFKMTNYPCVDIMFGNCHKWFCGPKGTAFIFKNTNSFQLRPAIFSHGLDCGFNSEFIWTGLRDYSSFLGLYANLSIWTECIGGFDTAIDYCTELARKASEYLKNAWSTGFLVDPKLCSSMVAIRLPDSFIKNVVLSQDKLKNAIEKLNYDYAELIQNFLYINYKIEVPIKCIQNTLYVRISCHIYNYLDEYIHLANVVLENFSK